MKVQLQAAHGGVVCRMSGDLDLLGKEALETSLLQIGGQPWVVFDLSQVPVVDTAGLTGLLHAVRWVRATGGDAAICCSQPAVRRVLEALVLPTSANVFDDEATAMEYLMPAQAA
ncbi:MAG: STAS domain-containing protein [Acidimicrobiales bacterium]